MAFVAKTEYFGNGSDSALAITDSDDGRSAAVSTQVDDRGDVTASTVHSDYLAPSNTYDIKADWTPDIVLGTVTTTNGHPIMLTSVTITTSAGNCPTVVYSGVEVESGGATDATVAEVSPEVSHYHKAQDVCGAATVTGGNITQCTTTIRAEPSTPSADGVRVAHDIHGGSVVASMTIKATTPGTAPTVAAASGWSVTSPLATNNPNEDYPDYTATLTKDLASTEPSA